MKTYKRIVKFVCVFSFVFVITLNGIFLDGINSKLAYGAVNETRFVVVGDSISYGMSADPGEDFADLYLQHLNLSESYGDVKLINLSKPGDKTKDLLQKLSTQSYTDTLADADIVVVSIGGNNLLSSIITAIGNALKVNVSNNPNLLSDLTNKLKTDKNAQQALIKLQSYESLAAIAGELENGVDNFSLEFPQIASKIKELAPNAQIYILNLYNPFNVKDPLNPIFNKFISDINNVISSKEETLGYTIVDVNKNFKGNSEAVKFNLSLAQIDPHPTNTGHDIIFKQLVSVEKPLYKKVADNASSANNTDQEKKLDKVDNKYIIDSNGVIHQGSNALINLYLLPCIITMFLTLKGVAK